MTQIVNQKLLYRFYYVLDIDSRELDDFDKIEKKYLKKIIEMI